MPELPEVETVRRGIAPLLEGRRLSRVIQRRDNLRLPLPDNFAARLEGRRVTQVGRRAKYLLIHLDGGETLICHLGMSGKMSLIAAENRRRPESYAKHDHVILETDRGDLVIYNDPRRFGLMTLGERETLAQHALFRGMGPEPLGNEFSGAYLMEKLAKRRSSVKAALLDQRVVAGLGNIYVCELLYEAGISPQKIAGDLTADAADKIVAVTRAVLARAIAAGGSTLKDYAHVDGELGYFQHQFKVYGRAGDPCRNGDCGRPIARLVQNARSTFYCPACQL